MTSNHKTGVKPKDALTTKKMHLIDFTTLKIKKGKQRMGETHD